MKQTYPHKQLISQLKEQLLLIINPRRRNGLILFKQYHAEFAGPGAAIGGGFDTDVVDVLPVGNFDLLSPQTSKERVSGYLIRRQWLKLTQQIILNPQALQRGQVLLNQFEHWFDPQTVAKLPDEAFARLIGVMPGTIKKARERTDRLVI